MSKRTLKILELAKKYNKKRILTEDEVQNNCVLDFDSDDSVRDPNFTLNDTCEYLESDEELIEMGHSIEQNILNSLSQNSDNMQNENIITSENENIPTSENAANENLPTSSILINASIPTNSYSRKESKRNRNIGCSYINVKGNFIPERKFKILNSDCRRKCQYLLSETAQKEIFDVYWSLGTYNQRVLFVSNLINICNTKTITRQKHSIEPRNRQYHIEYNLEYKGTKVRVCQKCFRQCLNETESFLKSVVKKKLDHPHISSSDRRGSGAGVNKLSEDVITTIKQHINEFPAYESHYSRRHTAFKYFHSDLTLVQMHKLYCAKYKSHPVGLTTYTKIFKTMNIKFKKPQIDTCATCDSLKARIDIAKKENKIELLKELERDLVLHHEKAEFAYQSKRNDKLLAANDPVVSVYTFDLQQCLPTPYLQNSLSFYKRKLWIFNFTVHDCVKGTPTNYMWHEAIAGRGGNEMSSCLFKHISSLQTDQQLKQLIFYSDSCVGQNKNSFVSTMFLMSFQQLPNLEIIDHKFLEVGHTHMECDTDHAAIERKKKRTDAKIFHPHDWYNLVRSVGLKKKFIVTEMKKKDFLNFSQFLKDEFVWRNRNNENEKFVWKNVKWLRYCKDNFGKIFYKNSLDEQEEFKILNILKRGHNFVNVNSIPKNKETAKISSNKKADLQDLLCFIDPCFHEFYKSLPTDDAPDIHPDLVEDESDVE